MIDTLDALFLVSIRGGAGVQRQRGPPGTADPRAADGAYCSLYLQYCRRAGASPRGGDSIENKPTEFLCGKHG